MDHEQPGQRVVRRFIEAVDARDMATIGGICHDDLVMEWPQSGERFRGKDNAIGAMSAQTVKPVSVGEPRIVGAGDVWAMMMPLRYGDEIWQYVGVFELDGDKIKRLTEYFGAPFPAQEFRRQFLDRR